MAPVNIEVDGALKIANADGNPIAQC